MNKIIFKNWAFRFMIWIIIINMIVFYLTINYVNFPGVENNTDSTLLYLEVISIVLMFLALAFIIMSMIRKEKRNYQFWIAIVGIFVLGIIPLILNFI